LGKAWGADLVVVGSGKHSIIERLQLGSTSTKVISACGCSVRVGRRLTTPANSSVRIVIGMDGSSDAELAVDAVARRVWPAGSEARLVTVLDTRLAHAVASFIPSLARWSGGGEFVQKDDAWVQRIITATTKKLQNAGLAVSTNTPEGDPREILVEAASSWNADCIFLGGPRAERNRTFSYRQCLSQRGHHGRMLGGGGPQRAGPLMRAAIFAKS
jgi:nucleotide-binding universal stress UspA family protein